MEIRRDLIFTESNNNQPISVRRTENKDLASSGQAHSTTQPTAQMSAQVSSDGMRQIPTSDYSKGVQERLKVDRKKGEKDILELGKIEGVELAVKETIAAQERFKIKLMDLADSSSKLLMKFKTIFPLDLFPDEITIDPMKITIVNHEFFQSAQVKVILISDLFDVTAGYSPLFASLKLICAKEKDPYLIQPLHKRDALKAQNVLQGLLVVGREKIDITKIPITESASQIETVGKAQIAI